MDQENATIRLDFKPLQIIVPEEREELYAAFKKAFQLASAIINNPKADPAKKFEAMTYMARLGRVMFSALKDVRLDEIIAKLEKMAEEEQ